MSKDFTVEIKEKSIQPGGEINGIIHWQFSSKPSKFILSLQYTTEGRGSQDKKKVFSLDLLPPLGAFNESGSHEFKFNIPTDIPPSYNGALIAILWKLKLQADIAWKIDPKTECSIVISPIGKALEPPKNSDL